MSNIDKIRQEIERRKKIYEGLFERESDTYYQGKAVAYGELLSFIDSLEQDEPEVDLEKEYKEYVEDDLVFSILTNRNVGLAIAKHFYELGINAGKV